jgi:hypothetical protein
MIVTWVLHLVARKIMAASMMIVIAAISMTAVIATSVKMTAVIDMIMVIVVTVSLTVERGEVPSPIVAMMGLVMVLAEMALAVVMMVDARRGRAPTQFVDTICQICKILVN